MQQKMKTRLMLWLAVSLFLSACGGEDMLRTPVTTLHPLPGGGAQKAFDPNAKNGVGKSASDIDDAPIEVALAGMEDKAADDTVKRCFKEASFKKPAKVDGADSDDQAMNVSAKDLHNVYIDMVKFLDIMVAHPKADEFFKLVDQTGSGPGIVIFVDFLLGKDGFGSATFDLARALDEVQKEELKRNENGWSKLLLGGIGAGAVWLYGSYAALTTALLWVPIGVGGAAAAGGAGYAADLFVNSPKKFREYFNSFQRKLSELLPVLNGVLSVPSDGGKQRERLLEIAKLLVESKSSFDELALIWERFYPESAKDNDKDKKQDRRAHAVEKFRTLLTESNPESPMYCVFLQADVASLFDGLADDAALVEPLNKQNVVWFRDFLTNQQVGFRAFLGKMRVEEMNRAANVKSSGPADAPTAGA